MSRLTIKDSSLPSTSASTSQEGLESGSSLASNRTLKVTLLSSEWQSTKGGLLTINRELAIQLAKHHNVEVSVYLPQCSEEDKRVAACQNVHLIKAGEMPGYDPIDWLATIPKDHVMDCVIGHGVHLGRQVPHIKRVHGHCKWIQVVHTDPEELGMFKSYADPISKGEKKQQAEVKLCELADQVVAVGPKLAEAFSCYLRSFGKDQDVLNLTPGVFSEFADVKQATEERRTFRVLVFGRGDSEDYHLKGYDIAAKAVAELKDMPQPYKLVFVGAPSGEEEKVKEMLLKEGIAPSQLTVRSFKEREQLFQQFSEADLAIMPSRTEGFGLAALEALSAGLPVLVSGNSGLGEALKKVVGGSSCVVNSEDPKEWAMAIGAVREKDRDVRLEEAKHLCGNYAQKYNWEEQCDRLVEMMLNITRSSSEKWNSVKGKRPLSPSTRCTSSPKQRKLSTSKGLTGSSEKRNSAKGKSALSSGTTCTSSPKQRKLSTSKEIKRSKPRSELPEEESNIHGHTKEVDSIVEALSDDSSSAVTGVLVSGIAGVGKSTVAIQAGHQLNDKFQRVVKFCSLRGKHSEKEEIEKNKNELDGELREILNVCVPGHQQTSENPRHVLLAWCRSLEYELTLLIDNAEDAMEDHTGSSFIELLKEMRMRSDPRIKFLITSRRSDIDRVTTGLFKHVEVGPLDAKESIEVLKDGANLSSHTGRETQIKLERISELCENIPLALRLAGPLFSSDSEYTFEELVTELENNPTRTLDLERMMKIAFRNLDEPLKHALVCLSVFDRSFDKNAAKALLGEDCAHLLMKLKKRCLVQKQHNRYLIHLLIRDFAKQIGKTDKFHHILARAQNSFAEYFLSLMLRNAEKYWGKDTCKESLDLFNEERLNLESTLRAVGKSKIGNCSELRDVLNLCQRVAPYIEYCVPYQLYDNFLEGLLHFAKKQKKVTKQVEILLLLYHESRKHGGANTQKSQDLMHQATKLHDKKRQPFKEESLCEIFYLSHYGRYLSQDCNQREEAQPFLEEAISIYEQEEHGAAFDKARILVQMGHNAKLHKDGKKHDVALANYKEALCFRQKHFGKHLLTAFAQKDLADYHLYIEDFDKAKQHYVEAISVLKSMERLDEKEAIPIFQNFGICYQKSGELDQAQTMFESGSDVADSTIEGNHKWKVLINTYLAVLLYKKCPDEVARADKICEEVLKMGHDLGLETWSAKKELEKLYKRD